MKKYIQKIAIALLVCFGLSEAANAAVITNDTPGAVGGGYAARNSHAVYLVPFTYDARQSGFALAASNDTVILINVRSNSRVRSIEYAVTVSNGQATTFNISDSRSATQFIATVTGTAELQPTSTPVGNTGFYASNDSIRIWANDALMTGIVVKGTAEIVDYSQ